jgi:enoyl-CoA hydratase
MAAVALGRSGAVALVGLSRPPVNAFDATLRRELFEAIDAADRDPAVGAIVLHGQGRGFSAGGDIHEFGSPAASAWPGMSSDLHPRIEACGKPVVAAVHGICLGGGFETALACHGRVASAWTQVGLPEVKVGALPLSGTQRLPRLLGLVRAAELIGSASVAPATEFGAAFDEIVASDDPGAIVEAAVALASRLRAAPAPLPLIRRLPVPADDRAAVEAIRDAAQDPVVRCAVEAVLAAVDEADFDAGLAKARALYAEVMRSQRSAELRRAFAARTS